MDFQPDQHTPAAKPNTDFLRRYARRILREARSDSPSKALPILRRVHLADTVPTPRLTDLYHRRDSLKLKHMLRTIAAELGYATWEACKRDVDRRPPSVLDRFRLELGAFGDYQQIWFSTAAEARKWQSGNGGQLVIYGSQAVVMTA